MDALSGMSLAFWHSSGYLISGVANSAGVNSHEKSRWKKTLDRCRHCCLCFICHGRRCHLGLGFACDVRGWVAVIGVTGLSGL